MLRGATDVIRHVDYVYAEVSFVELYHGQPLVGSILEYMRSLGFSLRGVYSTSVTDAFGVTQADFLFRASGALR